MKRVARHRDGFTKAKFNYDGASSLITLRSFGKKYFRWIIAMHLDVALQTSEVVYAT